MKAFHQRIGELVEEVMSWEDGPADFKRFIIHLLQKIQKAIADYRIDGSEALIHARIYIAGLEKLNDEWIREQTSKGSKAAEIWKKVQTAIGSLTQVVDTGEKLIAGATTVRLLLG